MQTLRQDLRYGARMFLGKLGFAPIAALTLAVTLVLPDSEMLIF
jgi:hypothetical protein